MPPSLPDGRTFNYIRSVNPSSFPGRKILMVMEVIAPINLEDNDLPGRDEFMYTARWCSHSRMK